jgi:hypothetical protein
VRQGWSRIGEISRSLKCEVSTFLLTFHFQLFTFYFSARRLERVILRKRGPTGLPTLVELEIGGHATPGVLKPCLLGSSHDAPLDGRRFPEIPLEPFLPQKSTVALNLTNRGATMVDGRCQVEPSVPKALV